MPRSQLSTSAISSAGGQDKHMVIPLAPVVGRIPTLPLSSKPSPAQNHKVSQFVVLDTNYVIVLSVCLSAGPANTRIQLPTDIFPPPLTFKVFCNGINKTKIKPHPPVCHLKIQLYSTFNTVHSCYNYIIERVILLLQHAYCTVCSRDP